MSSVFDAPWFYWAIGVAVGFPVCLVFLTEVHNALLRRGNALARPVHLLRNYILPLGALLIHWCRPSRCPARRRRFASWPRCSVSWSWSCCCPA